MKVDNNDIYSFLLPFSNCVNGCILKKPVWRRISKRSVGSDVDIVIVTVIHQVKLSVIDQGIVENLVDLRSD